MGGHPGRVLPLLDFAQQVEVVDIEGQEALVLGVPPVGTIWGAVGEDGLCACGDGVQVALDGRPDSVLREPLVPPPGTMYRSCPRRRKPRRLPCLIS